ncbi:MAG: type VI secretion system contractile sheath small subunit [Verrucomicrobiales bacterium]|nr:type VI secretion system contractile sheath small subunit [Verrucomicrobiales bacterium]
MPANTQHRLDRVRRPRVQITYDVEIGGAIEKKELPFVVGILSDLSGNAGRPLPKLRARKFVNLDRDNFEEVLASITPRLSFLADNTLAGDGSKLKVELEFKKLEDFEPVQVISQIEPLRKLLDARRRLADLLAKLDGNDELEHTLQEVISNTDQLKQIQSAAAPPSTAPASVDAPAAATTEAAAEKKKP